MSNKHLLITGSIDPGDDKKVAAVKITWPIHEKLSSDEIKQRLHAEIDNWPADLQDNN